MEWYDDYHAQKFLGFSNFTQMVPAKGLVMLSNALVWMSEAECP